MKAPEQYRPYNHEQATMGAPICLSNGAKVTILHTTIDKLIGMFAGVDETLHAGEWSLDGSFNDLSWEKGRMDIVMLPLGMLDFKPVFVGDVLEHCQTGARHEVGSRDSVDLGHYRWPIAAQILPRSRMNENELCMAFGNAPVPYAMILGGLKMVAKETLERSIRDGDVVPAEMIGRAIRLTIDAGRHARTWRDIDPVEIVRKVRSSAMGKAGAA